MRRLCLAAIALATIAACGTPPGTPRKLVVLAVEGLDPDITARLIRERRLPNLAALAGASDLVRVTSTPGAESSAAWASFATGVNAGVHGVFDLVAPDPVTARPSVSTLVPRPSAQWLRQWWSEGSAYAVTRGGEPFWARLGSSGVRGSVLFVPGTFPPEPFPNGDLIAGTPLPDLAGGLGASTWLATDVPASMVGRSRFGGHVIRLTFERNVAYTAIAGIRTPVVMDLPLAIAWNPEARSANITIGDTFVHLAEGQQSRWLDVSLQLNLLTRIDGLVRMHLLKAGNDVRLHISPVNWHPHRPPSPISAPPQAADGLFERLGPYRTLAWPAAGWALADGRMDEDEFLAVLDETFTDRAESLLNRLESHDWDLIVAGFETIDQVQHLMWRFVDPGHAMHVPALVPKYSGAIEKRYMAFDDLVGRVREMLPPEANLAVVSAYGVYTARYVVDLNRWLTDQGLLSWRQPPRPVTLAALTDPEAWSDDVDWSKTSARALGYGQIFVNRQGRDPHGIVAPGDAYEALLASLRSKLETLTDPISGRRVVSRVRLGRDLYHGDRADRAPDLVVTLSPGYRVSWETVLGGAAAAVTAPNEERWSAEHASMDEDTVPGVWLSTFPVVGQGMSVLDVAPTILQYFGQAAAPDLEGISRLAGAHPQP